MDEKLIHEVRNEVHDSFSNVYNDVSSLLEGSVSGTVYQQQQVSP